MDVDEFASILGVFQDHHHKNSLALKCPKCNQDHPYKSASDDNDMKDFQVFYSGGLHCSERSQDCADHAMFVISCGHVVCSRDFEKLGGKVGVSKLSCRACVDKEDKNNGEEKRYSHGARAIVISGKEQCPICWDDFTDESSMVALACGHVVCTNDFRKLGGKTGQDALLSPQDLISRQQQQVRQLQNEYGSTLSQLIASVSSSEDVRRVEISLALLRREFTCESGDAATFVQLTGPAAMIQAMRRFEQSPDVQFSASALLVNLTCREHQTPEDCRAYSNVMINAGAISACVQTLRNEQNPVHVLVPTCRLLSGLFKTNFVDSMKQFKAVVGALLFAMERAPNMVTVQEAILQIFADLTMHGGEGKDCPFRRQLVKMNGVNAIVAAMRRFPNDSLPLISCIGSLCHIALSPALGVNILKLGGIELVCQAMQDHSSIWHVQRNGCNFLWAIANCPPKHAKAVGKSLISSSPVARLRDAMANFPDDDEIQKQSCSALNSLASNFKRLRLEIVQTGCLELVAKAIKDHPRLENPHLWYEALCVLKYLAPSKEKEIRLALSMTDAIPAVQLISSTCESFSVTRFRMRNADRSMLPSVDSFLLMALSEISGDVLGKLGAQEVQMLFDDEYDFDDDERGAIESPPFDINNILDKDLTTESLPGWYKNRPFHIDSQHSLVLAEERGSTFLCRPTAPQVGQQLCVRVSLPYGGRGYLYGEITRVGPVPSDEELRASDSSLFEKPCPCDRPECHLKSTNRRDLLSIFGALHGQEVTATVSLESPFLQRKLRFKPLPAFFGGLGARFDMILRWSDNEQDWEVTKISKHGKREP